jgi:hypothetical protein
MKKSVFIVVAFSFFALLLLVEKRKFYKIGDNYFTLWKMNNDSCFLIWGKYYGLFSPHNGYIKSSYTNYITLYLTKNNPKMVVYKSDQPVFAKNSDIYFEKFENKSQMFHSLFYENNKHTFKDLKKGSNAIIILIKEEYAINEKGKRQ